MSSSPLPESPWARPSADGGAATDAWSVGAGEVHDRDVVPASGFETWRRNERPGAEPIRTRVDRSGRARAASGGVNPSPTEAGRLEAGRIGSGLVVGPMSVLGSGAATSGPGESTDDKPDAAAARRRMLLWFGGAAGGVIAAGVVIMIMMVAGGHSPFPKRSATPPDTRPILAKLCPPPSAAPPPSGPVPATPAGPRTVDADSGISYRAFGAPWERWTQDWETGGQLGVVFRTGQFFVTEPYPGGGEYMATILSGSVPAATNDAMTLDLKCAGHQLAADVRVAYYPHPNTMHMIVDKATTVGGRPAWLSEFDLRFHLVGLKAKDEMVALALIDIGKPDASILYISIPGTHKQYDYVINQLLASVRPT